MAFVVKGVTQVSYYFSIRIVIDTDINSASPPAVDFVKIIQIDRCSPNGSSSNQCQVEVTIASCLMFCSDPTCTVVATTPFYVLYLNRVFWMLHKIND